MTTAEGSRRGPPSATGASLSTAGGPAVRSVSAGRLRYASGMARKPQEGPPGAQEQPQTFEAALGELEEIVGRMESGQVSLDESLRLYERGTFLIQHCQTRLDTAEKQIERLTRGKDGRLDATPEADQP